MHDFKDRLDKLHQLYIREAYSLKRQMELPKIQKAIQHSENFAFTPVGPQMECKNRVYLNKVHSHKNQIKRFLDPM